MRMLLKALCLCVCLTSLQALDAKATDPWSDFVENCKGDYPVYEDEHTVWWHNGTWSEKNEDGTWTNRDKFGNVWKSRWPLPHPYFWIPTIILD